MGEENSDVRGDIVAWSFSRLMDYEACPYRFYLKHIAKAEQPELDKDHLG
jgi:ATP-dependent helicase/DNAse subunit B